MRRAALLRHAPRMSLLAFAVALAFATADKARALPQGEQIVAGKVVVGRPAAGTMIVQQGSGSAIVNWQGFSIQPGESVRIQQPQSSSLLLNRVVGGDPSRIFGQLSANGKVFLVNPSGVLFGAGSSVDVGSLVASSLGLADADFLSGHYRFGGSGGEVVNQGSITAAERGTVALLGGSVSNDGRISAKLGTVALAAGSRLTLDLAGDGLSSIAVTQSALDAQVVNGGAIIADGGAVLLKAGALDALVGTAVNQRGLVRARSLVERNGRIVLDGGDSGTTMVSGSLDATGSAAGTRGGEIQVLGRHVGVTGSALLDASGIASGGAVLVGGDSESANPVIPNASASFVGTHAVLRADAIDRGNGGRVVVRGDDAVRVHGTLSARGGPQGGDGGLVETSGKFLDTAAAIVNAGAPLGKAGQWLLDPADITIVSGEAGASVDAGVAPNFSPVATPSSVTDTDVNAALKAGTNVSVQTSSTVHAVDFGDLTMNGAANIQPESVTKMRSFSSNLLN